MSSREEVFKEKVLKKLYHFQLKNVTPQKPTNEEKCNITTKDVEIVASESSNAEISVNCDSTKRKVYTVCLPPNDYKLGIMENDAPAEDSSSQEDTEDDDDNIKTNIPKRKRRRNKTGIKKLSACETIQNTTDTDLSSLKTSKNRKRKLKKKRHKEKLHSAGMLCKSVAVEFTYQPKETKSATDDEKMSEGKIAELQEFFQSTLELYFADCSTKNPESIVSPSIFHLILEKLSTRAIVSSDMALLFQMKSFILQQDIENLKNSLDTFQTNTKMPPDEATAVCSLFNYWMKDILPT
ncbi:glutamate-rich protein 1 [Erpetoichthys calabaricus]|uniref:Glutamate rich 1 n=1 Tax=Erpetoichthys calabaricus TaxID=27687 RepID=A0A8C4REZ8_ERPCA|nr:glutamate-rich protein 1 [Erpetoichthys calabaricus]XP_028653596.1 glutamate-rich protein 1 [Erpetoichthys calabaricus]